MSEILVTYASKHGHTGKIAARIARAAAEAGASVELRDVEGAAHVDLADYDAVVVGSSIHAGKHPREIIDWAREHHAALNALPSAFFTVCLSAAEDTAGARRPTRGYLDAFLQAPGWTPATPATSAGALQSREYAFMPRL